MMSYLKALTQLRNVEPSARSKHLDRQERLVLLGAKVALSAQKIFAETQELAQQIAKICQGLVIARLKSGMRPPVGLSLIKYRPSRSEERRVGKEDRTRWRRE